MPSLQFPGANIFGGQKGTKEPGILHSVVRIDTAVHLQEHLHRQPSSALKTSHDPFIADFRVSLNVPHSLGTGSVVLNTRISVLPFSSKQDDLPSGSSPAPADLLTRTSIMTEDQLEQEQDLHKTDIWLVLIGKFIKLLALSPSSNPSPCPFQNHLFHTLIFVSHAHFPCFPSCLTKPAMSWLKCQSFAGTIPPNTACRHGDTGDRTETQTQSATKLCSTIFLFLPPVPESPMLWH